MMTGSVANLYAVLPVTLQLPGQPNATIDFVVDTGFTGFLTLPVNVVAALNLPFVGNIAANLADDSEVQMPVHAAVLLWNGAPQTVRVLATGRRPLLGTGLLRGQELVAQFVEGGLLTVDDL